MAGTVRGGRKAAQTNKLRHGADFYEGIGRQGGKTKTDRTYLKGWGTHRDRASEAGRKGGKNGRRQTAVAGSASGHL